jgi:hypothetical protein
MITHVPQIVIESRRLTTFTALILVLLGIGSVDAQERPFEIELELGAAWQARNDVQIPNNVGNRFSLDDVVGSGPWA